MYTPLTLPQYQKAIQAGFTPDKIIANEKIRQQQENAPKPAPQPQQSTGQKIGSGIMQGLGQAAQAGVGALKSIGATVNNASELGQRALQGITSHLPGMPKTQIASLPDAVVKPTQDVNQQAGFLGGQIGQAFAIPNSAIDIGASAVANLANLGKAQPLLVGGAKAIAQAGTGALASKLGGATDKQALTAGAVSGGLSVAGSLFSQALKGSAEKSMSKALGATTKSNKMLSDKVVPGLVEKNTIALTRGSLYNKAAENVDKADQALTDAYGSLPKGIKSDWTPVLQTLEDQKEALKVNGTVMDVGKYNSLHQVQSDLLNVIGGGATEVKNGSVPIEDARKARQILDGMVKNKTFGITGAENDKLNATKEAANAIRSQLAKEHPDIAILNKQFSFWENVQDVVGATMQRTKNQTSLSGELAMDTGAVTGGQMGGLGKIIEGGVVGKLLKSALQSTAWRTTSAVVKSKLADLLASGDVAKATVILQKLATPTKALPEKK